MYASKVVVVIAVPSAQLQQSVGLGRALAISGEGYWYVIAVAVEGLCVPLGQPYSPSPYDDVPQEESVWQSRNPTHRSLDI
jgi:hypothetical protein